MGDETEAAEAPHVLDDIRRFAAEPRIDIFIAANGAFKPDTNFAMKQPRAGHGAAAMPGARTITMWNAEAEYAVAYTRLSAEYTHEHFAWGTGHADAATWYVQGVQTLSPRWFAAGRAEAIRSPRGAQMPVSLNVRSFVSTEGTAGFRVTPEVTLRASVTTSRWYLAPSTDRRAGLQVVWTPGDATEAITRAVLEAIEPDLGKLRPVIDTATLKNVLSERVHCTYCKGPFVVTMPTCPHCGAPAPQVAALAHNHLPRAHNPTVTVPSSSHCQADFHT